MIQCPTITLQGLSDDISYLVYTRKLGPLHLSPRRVESSLAIPLPLDPVGSRNKYLLTLLLENDIEVLYHYTVLTLTMMQISSQ